MGLGTVEHGQTNLDEKVSSISFEYLNKNPLFIQKI